MSGAQLRNSLVECGLVYFVHRDIFQSEFDERTVPIPLQSVDIVASVVHAVAQVELTQVYVNKEDQPIEAIYYFPIDSNGGVTHFHAELEGRIITGSVKPTEEANAEYQKAIEQKQTAFLLESNKPDIFKMHVGFLKPGAQVKIVIGYVTEVKNEKGSNSIRFLIPTTVAPRYIGPTETDTKSVDLKNMTFSETSPAPLKLTVIVAIQGKIKSLECPTHQIKVETKTSVSKGNWDRAVVTLDGDMRDMDRDFVLLICPEEVHAPRLYSEKVESSTALMAYLIPRFKLDEQKVELMFLLDRSGSMQGASIDLAKKALMLILHSLPADCYFNIIGYGSSFEFLFPKSVMYNDRTLSQAIRHCKNLEADLGGTEIFQPLKAIYSKDVIRGYPRQIFALTDGDVSNTEQVIGICKANAHTTRVFALGIGDSASHHLVEGLAQAGGGTAAFTTYSENMDSKVLHQLQNAIQPSLTNVTIKWKGIPEITSTSGLTGAVNTVKSLVGYGLADTSTTTQQKQYWEVPEKIPPIFDGTQLVVFGVFSAEVPTGVEIIAESPDGPLSIQMELSEENEIGSSGMIHKLAGIKAIQELELKEAGLKLEGGQRSTLDDLKTQIVNIACQNGLASKYTSFVAVDTASDVKVENDWIMETRYVPSQYANGWGGTPLINSPPGLIDSGTGRTPQQIAAMRRYQQSQAQVDEVVDIMRSNVEKVLERDSRLSDLDDRADALRQGAFQYEQQAKKLKRKYWWNNLQDSSGWKSGEDSVISSVMSTMRRWSTSVDSESVLSFFDKKDEVRGQRSPEEILHALVATQSYNGSFPLNKELSDAIGLPLDILLKECEKNGWNKEAWATALALTYLTEKLSDMTDRFILVESKGRKWLQKNFDEQINFMLSAAKDIFAT